MLLNQAPKGGTIGVNGEFYRGGLFLPSNPNRAKQHQIRNKGRKYEIEPYKWSSYDGCLSEGEFVDGFYKLLSESFHKNFIYQGGSELEYKEFITPYKEAWDQGKRWRVFSRLEDGSIKIIRFE